MNLLHGGYFSQVRSAVGNAVQAASSAMILFGFVFTFCATMIVGMLISEK